jgi:2-polyprenyl-3-methyl-5-hydroxy-6-metoxy-1,4-benzoquinol methylase
MINEQSQKKYFNSIRSEMIPFLPEEYSKVLEIGCNVGNFRQNVSKKCEYWGVEPFEEAANVAKTKLDKVLIGFYDKVENQIPDNYFDLIIANDVIEHVEQPWNLLQSLKTKMSPNASLVLSVPNVRYYRNLIELLQGKDWRYKDCGILDITHLRFFTEKSIVRLLNELGFEIEQMQGVSPIKTTNLGGRKGRLKYWFFKLVFGKDIEFLQFGLRVKISEMEGLLKC